MKNKIMLWSSYLMILITFSFLITIFFGLFYPYKTVDVKNLKIVSITNRPLDIEDIVTVSFDYIKYIDVPAEFSVELIPAKKQIGGMNMVYQLQSGKVNSPIGCFRTVKQLKIGEEIVSGNYKMRLTLVYVVNPIRTITRVFETINYVVIVNK